MNLLTTLLITLFTAFLLLLAAALTYVILRRIRFHRRSLHPNEEPTQPDQPSKELLYFLCCQNQNPSRIKPTTTATATATAPPLPPPPTEDDDTLAKWHLGFFHEGPSRLLFTIKKKVNVLLPTVVYTSLLAPAEATRTGTDQTRFSTLMKNSLSGKDLTEWDVNLRSYCNFTGVGCDDQGQVDEIDISGWFLSGHFPNDICAYLPNLRVLRLSGNNLQGNFLNGIANCSLLQELNMSSIYLRSTLPDFSEYAYSAKATTKCDMYSYGIVLLELITGKKPVEADFGDNKSIEQWVSTKVDTKEGVMEILDKRLSGSFRDEILDNSLGSGPDSLFSETSRRTIADDAPKLRGSSPVKKLSYSDIINKLVEFSITLGISPVRLLL